MSIYFFSFCHGGMCIKLSGSNICFILQTHSNNWKYVSIAENINVVKYCMLWNKSSKTNTLSLPELMELANSKYCISFHAIFQIWSELFRD